MTVQNRHNLLKASKRPQNIHSHQPHWTRWQLLSDLVALSWLFTKTSLRRSPSPPDWNSCGGTAWGSEVAAVIHSDRQNTGIQMKKIKQTSVHPRADFYLRLHPELFAEVTKIMINGVGVECARCNRRFSFPFEECLQLICITWSISFTEGVYCQRNHCRSYQSLHSPAKSDTLLICEFNWRLNQHVPDTRERKINW